MVSAFPTEASCWLKTKLFLNFKITLVGLLYDFSVYFKFFACDTRFIIHFSKELLHIYGLFAGGEKTLS